MRILMIGQLPKEAGGNYTTGAAKVVYELSRQKVEGVTVYVLATNASAKSVKPYCSYKHQYIGYNLPVWTILKDFLLHPKKVFHEWYHYIRVDHENPLRYAFYKANIRRAIEIIQPDLIHVHSIGNVSSTRFAIGNRSIPLLLTCHGIFYRGDTNDLTAHDRYMGNLPLCDYYTGLTEEARYELRVILKIPAEKFFIIPNGVDSSLFFFSEEWRRRMRNEMMVSGETIVFITVASLQERKGQLSFIKLLEKLGVNYQYWLIGNGPDKELIENYIAEHQLKEKVKLLGYFDSKELYRYYSAADVYAHSSWKEGQALSEIEARSTGLRVIVNKAVAGTLMEDPMNNRQYCVVDFDNVFKDSIIEWLSEKDHIRVSRNNYDWKYILRRYSEVYQIMI